MTKQRVVSIPHMAGAAVDVLSESTAHWLSTGELPAELVTGHKLIDSEHRFLIAAIANLRRVCIDHVNLKDCTGCSDERQQRCEADVIAMLGDVFAFILDHFKTEEMVMRDSLLLMVDRDVCEAHMEDHAAISSAVQQIVSSLDSHHIVSRIRELDALLARWVTNHIALHDLILSRWIARDDSLLRDL
ncbi:MAG: hemerythrin domain-containing protein [Dechloromonas sp.]|uniref:bacteriohemerythrin n=1 Tax=Dechloromonas sp. TaxID=1917218 RepID=UPI0027FA3AAE|nr:hemerythrin domain-containing protein [Dechloromonas sp.]MBT9521570.1 hemerythrin domain-containing protein [Dechloromonas sp.]